VERPPIITRKDLAWVALIVATVVALFAAALVVGMALSALSFPWGPVVALVLIVLVAILILSELRSFWARLPR
jgi:hypothetical protein